MTIFIKLWLFSVAYAQIDWHDFVVVETVDYQPNEMGHFPSPTTPDEVGARVLMQERYDNDPEAAGAEEEEEKAAKSKDRQTEKRESKVTGDDVEMELSDKEDGGAEVSQHALGGCYPRAVPCLSRKRSSRMFFSWTISQMRIICYLQIFVFVGVIFPLVHCSVSLK